MQSILSAMELNTMTLQVALVGIDGVVVASDRLLQQWEMDRTHSGYSLSLSSKFDQHNDFVCCASGDKISELTSSLICQLNWDDAQADVKASLNAAAKDAWSRFDNPAAFPPIIRKVIIICPDRSAWILDTTSHEAPFTNRILNKVVAGDIKNTARHIINNYLPNDEAPLALPISKLIVPAAHAVLMGGRENPTGVGGIEIIVIPKTASPMVLPPELERRITAISERIYRSTKKQILQQFDYMV
jgi:hypothetical protein